MFLIEISGGPVRSQQVAVPEITPGLYFQIKNKQWVYYYCTGIPKKPTSIEDSKQSGRGKRKKNYPQALYQWCRPFGAVDESHMDIQTHLNYYVKRFGHRPPQID